MKAQKWGRIVFISSIAAYGGGLNGCRTYLSSFYHFPFSFPFPAPFSSFPLPFPPSHPTNPQPSPTDYAASKGGILSMMRNLSTHLAAHSITVNDVAPAMVGSTGMIPNAEAVPGLTDMIPLHRLCEPQEVANVVRMFVTTGFATGQSLMISGGLK
jgi:3-oxoacyl-[acyl-carrier protein] reductase